MSIPPERFPKCGNSGTRWRLKALPWFAGLGGGSPTLVSGEQCGGSGRYLIDPLDRKSGTGLPQPDSGCLAKAIASFGNKIASE